MAIDRWARPKPPRNAAVAADDRSVEKPPKETIKKEYTHIWLVAPVVSVLKSRRWSRIGIQFTRLGGVSQGT